jgi:hypothetical protein
LKNEDHDKWRLLRNIYFSNDPTGPHALRATDTLLEAKISMYDFEKQGLITIEPGGVYGTVFRLTPCALQLLDLMWN